MSAYFLTTDNKIEEALATFFNKRKLKSTATNSTETLFSKAMQELPKIIFIDVNFDTVSAMFDLVRDLRGMFGSILTICLVGKSIGRKELSHFIGVGVDGFFDFPLDFSLIEEIMRKNAYENICSPFKYRNIPSGSSPINVSCKINLFEISNVGIKFWSDIFFCKGFMFKIDLDSFLDTDIGTLRFKVFQNPRNEETGNFEYFAEFYEISNDQHKHITFALKNDSK